MISRLYAVALLMFRSAVRARLLVSLTVILVLVLLTLPMAIKGDGSLAGTVQIMLKYVLGISLFILGIATLWVSCGGVSRDVEQHLIHLVVTKPVRPLELWIGKWLGILLLNSLLILLVFVALYVSLQVRLAAYPADGAERTVVTARVTQPHSTYPALPDDVSRELESRLAPYRKEGSLPAGIQLNRVRETLTRRIMAERSTVAPQGQREWVVELQDAVTAGHNAHIGILLLPPLGRVPRIQGEWRVSRADGGPEHVIEHDVYTTDRIPLPGHLVSRPGSIRIQFTNLDRGPRASTVVFDMFKAVEIRVPTSSFFMNYVRAMLILLLQLSAVAAFGLLAGSCFSFPVATFTAGSLLCLSFLGQAFMKSRGVEIGIPVEDLPTEAGSRAIYLTGEKLITLFDAVTRPALGRNPLEVLGQGGLVSWASVGSSALVLLLLYCLVPAVLSSLLLSRKELAGTPRT